MAEVGIVVNLKVKPGMNAEFEKVFAEQAANCAKNEPGQMLYKLFKRRDDAQAYVIMERYKDADALGVHGKAEWMGLTRDRIRATLDGAISANVVDAV
jgi:quinol monooxygenase YgiN